MGKLNEENHIEKIIRFKEKDWKPLLDLIPAIEQVETFRIETEPFKIENDTVYLSQWRPNPVVGQFLEVVYDIPAIINFDWASWDEGRTIAGNPDTDYDAVTITAKCKLLTAFVRNDRFCDGALVSKFEDGTILRILKSIRKQVFSGRG